jgi:hypothetical protein
MYIDKMKTEFVNNGARTLLGQIRADIPNVNISGER